jgi:hypothetical protein
MKFLKRNSRGEVYPVSVRAVLLALSRAKLFTGFRDLEAGRQVYAGGVAYRRAGDDAPGWCERCYKEPCHFPPGRPGGPPGR